MNRELLAKTRQWKKTRTGKFEITGFAATDEAVAREINKIFSNVVVTHPSRGRERFAEFLKRKPEDRVFVGNFDSVVEFLGAVRRAAADCAAFHLTKSLTVTRCRLSMFPEPLTLVMKAMTTSVIGVRQEN